MTQYLLRIEAVNLEQVLQDTDQLSVIRGGGLQALEAVRRYDPEWPSQVRMPIPETPGQETPTPELISGGASVGLYRLDLPPDDSKEPHQALTDKIAEDLAAAYPHHTFVVDIEPVPQREGGFATARERVIAKNRLRQMQQPTLAVPPMSEGAVGPCDWDDLRPAVVEQQLRSAADGTPRSVRLSRSVHDRYRYGTEQKKRFLDTTTGLDLDYTDDFEQLAGDFPQDRRLQNKLAVLYFDGNHFGKHQGDCETPEALQQLDRYLRDQRKRLLKGLIGHLSGLPGAFCRSPVKAAEPAGPKAERLRFELLLWGGDEILFVVPAWLGLEALFHFYAATGDWTWNGAPLTHAGALIFCDHKTPIDRMTSLARDLAEDRVKEFADGTGREHNRFEYMILESIDFPAERPDAYLQQRYPALHPTRRPLSPVPSARDLIARLAALRDSDEIPHGPIHEGALRLVRDCRDCRPDEEAERHQRDLEQRAAASGETAQEALTALQAHLTELFPEETPAWRWVHLAELWDYLAPRAGTTGKGALG